MSDRDFTFQDKACDRIEWDNNKVLFVSDGEIILTLDKDGMTYNGQRVEDAGKAHKAFLDTMEAIRNE